MCIYFNSVKNRFSSYFLSGINGAAAVHFHIEKSKCLYSRFKKIWKICKDLYKWKQEIFSHFISSFSLWLFLNFFLLTILKIFLYVYSIFISLYFLSVWFSSLVFLLEILLSISYLLFIFFLLLDSSNSLFFQSQCFFLWNSLF